jgi:hypothetical protein
MLQVAQQNRQRLTYSINLSLQTLIIYYEKKPQDASKGSYVASSSSASRLKPCALWGLQLNLSRNGFIYISSSMRSET